MKKVTKKDVLVFLRKTRCAAIATTNKKGNPETSEVYFGVDDQFNIYITIGSLSRKYKNLKKNKQVAFVAGNPEKQITVQMEGEASEIKRVRKGSKAIKALMKAHSPTVWETISHLWESVPPVLKMQNGDLIILKLKPAWMRWADFSGTVKKNEDYFQQILP